MVVVYGVSVTPGVVVSRFPLPLSSSSSSARPLNTGFNGNSSVSFFLKKHPLSRKIFAGNQSAEFDSKSNAFAASEKVLVPGNIDDDDDASMVTEGPSSFSEESQILNLENQTVEENGAARTEDEASVFDSSKASEGIFTVITKQNNRHHQMTTAL